MWSANPIVDAERATWDTRSYIRCNVCGERIYMPNDTYAGDSYYDIEGEAICEDCFPSYAKKHWYRSNDYA